MNPLEIIALILIAAVVIKLIVVSISPMSWKPVVKSIYGRPVVTKVVALVLAAAVLYYLLQELTIVQVFASMAFMIALMLVQFSSLGVEIGHMADKFLSDRSIMKKLWLTLTLWLVLMGWVLYEIFI